MATQLEPELQRWVQAKIIDLETASRIRAFEEDQGGASARNWPMLIAVGFGALMLGAGVLLFVASHWDNMSAASRFALVLAMIAAFHIAGILTAESSGHLSIAMHVLGTLSVGAAIFLTGQIFNLQEHWPTGVLLWSVAAWVGWALLRQWPQFAFAAVLTPAWLMSEWTDATRGYFDGDRILLEGLLLLSVAYFTSRSSEIDNPVRKCLAWIGGLALIPAFLFLAFRYDAGWRPLFSVSTSMRVAGWCFALLGPLAVAGLLRKRRAWPMLLAVIWVLVFGTLSFDYRSTDSSLGLYAWHSMGPYLWAAAGSIGFIAWGVLDRMKSRINLGMVLFVISLLCFYFSDLLDKLGRSVSLIGFGILFLVIGYFLEKTRKRLIAQIREATA